MTDLWRAKTIPGKYTVNLPFDKIVSDNIVDNEYVRRLAKKDTSKFEPILVIKHPNAELYTVLDGHHRFKAAKLSGRKTIKAVVVDDFRGLGFEIARRGVFQSSPEFTRYVRLPLRKFMGRVRDFLFGAKKRR